MYPNNQEQPAYSIDYLNQIAPQPQKRGLFNNRRPLIIILAVALILGLLIIIIGSVLPKKPNQLVQLAARLQSTEKIASDAQQNIQDSQLLEVNSSFDLYLTNINRDIATPLASTGINVASLDKKIVAQESGADLVAKLEDARLNAVYDTTYAREMAYRLDTIILLMKDIYNSTSNSQLKNFLQSSYQELGPVQKQFADFNAGTS